MMTKIVGILVVVLAITLVGGTGYLLAQSKSEVTVNAAGDLAREGNGGQRSGGNYSHGDMPVMNGDAQRVQGSAGQGRGQRLANQSAETGDGQGMGAGSREPLNAASAGEGHAEDWETLVGVALSLDGDLLLRTSSGDEVLVGLGPLTYQARADFALAVGDELAVLGFHEDGEFKAGTVENLTTGQTLLLRDETGRPIWAGNGQRKNQRS